MTKRFVIALLSSLIICASGCAPSGEPGTDGTGPDVVCTIFAPYDFAREVAGDTARVTMLLPPAAELHSFEPAPQDIIKIQDCDVFVYIGGESEDWVGGILESLDLRDTEIVRLIDCVDTVPEEHLPGMESQASHEEPSNDEHIWTSPKNAKLMTAAISDALCRADPEREPVYRENEADYLSRLDGLDAAFLSALDGAARKTLVFGDRFPFRYFADEYGLSCFAAFPGCAPETEASAATVAFLIDMVRREDIPVVFHAELSNKKTAETISEATGAQVRLLHACHNISREDFENGVGYLELMTRNALVLSEALS